MRSQRLAVNARFLPACNGSPTPLQPLATCPGASIGALSARCRKADRGLPLCTWTTPGWFGATILVAFGLACEQTMFQPPTTPGPITPAPAGLVRLELIAPESIAPGESVQLTANARRATIRLKRQSTGQMDSQDPGVLQTWPRRRRKGIGAWRSGRQSLVWGLECVRARVRDASGHLPAQRDESPTAAWVSPG